jgi:DNA-binding IclR family transcriptional regulator
MIRGRESKSAPVAVVTRVLRILEVIRDTPAGVYLRDVARLTDINKSTAYRILAHLESEGYLFRGSEGAYFIGPKLVRLASANNHQAVLRDTSRPILHRLWQATGETVNLAVPDGTEMLYLDVIESPHSFRLVSHAGMRRPMHCTALGKAVMAQLPSNERDKLLQSLLPKSRNSGKGSVLAQLRKELAKVSKQGYAVDDQETTLGARCVGAPVFDETGAVVGSISISGPTTRVGRKEIRSLGAKVAAAAQAISARL